MINLHINLLLDSERRSSSRISRRFFIGAAAGLAGIFFLIFVVVAVLGARLAGQALQFAEQEKKQVEPLFHSVSALRQELTELQDLTNAVATWARTRPDWPGLLSEIQSVVPPNIQLTRLTLNENIAMIDNGPARVVALYLNGKAAGEHAEIAVQQFEKNLKEKPVLKEVVEKAEVKQFDAVKNEDQKNLRIFDLECRFKPLKLYQPAPDQPPK